MDGSILQNPYNPFVVWTYVLGYGGLLGYLGYLLWRYRREK